MVQTGYRYHGASRAMVSNQLPVQLVEDRPVLHPYQIHGDFQQVFGAGACLIEDRQQVAKGTPGLFHERLLGLVPAVGLNRELS